MRYECHFSTELPFLKARSRRRGDLLSLLCRPGKRGLERDSDPPPTHSRIPFLPRGNDVPSSAGTPTRNGRWVGAGRLSALPGTRRSLPAFSPVRPTLRRSTYGQPPTQDPVGEFAGIQPARRNTSLQTGSFARGLGEVRYSRDRLSPEPLDIESRLQTVWSRNSSIPKAWRLEGCEDRTKEQCVVEQLPPANHPV